MSRSNAGFLAFGLVERVRLRIAARDVAEVLLRRQPGLETVERFLQRAARLGLVVRVTRNRFFPPEAVRRLGEMAESLGAAADDGMFSTAAFRDRSGIGRNLAIEVLEYFDKLGFTRRSDNSRRVLKPADEVRWLRAS